MILPETAELFLFLGATILLNLTPGPDVLYVAGQSLKSQKQGIIAALGISAGIIVHIIAATLGISEVIKYSPIAFLILKIVGASYLGYLAWCAFFEKTNSFEIIPSKKIHFHASFLKGILTTLLNPKVGLFFLSFIPQFIDANRGSIPVQFLSLGLIFIVSGTIVNLFYSFIFSTFKENIFDKKNVRMILNKLMALLFVGFGVRILVEEI